MAKYTYGIDLGTTYSCISYVDETGRANVIKNIEGDNTTPSVVNFADPNTVVVGEVAKENAVMDPENTVSLVKTLMGKTNFAINYDGRDISPEEVSSYILKKVAQDASKTLGEEVKDVVITCPAYFGTAEREATKKAGELADLNVIEIISEPTAAAIYYGCMKEQDEKTILVFDLGGGTFDVTIMRISKDNIEVICSDGNHDLGGKDWDSKVINYLIGQFNEATSSEEEPDLESLQDLRLKAEKAKIQLSSKEETPITVEINGERERISLSREIFDQITEELLAEAISKTDDAIKVAKDKGYNVDELLLVGGSTRMPQVTKAIKEKYGIEPKILDPDEAVAKGASIYALGTYELKYKDIQDKIKSGEIDLSDEKQKEEADKYLEAATVSSELLPGLGGKPMNEVITVATTKSYAVKAIDQKTNKEQCFNMIIKNTPMPNGVITATQRFGTQDDNQENAEIAVYESDFDTPSYDVDEDFYLGNAILDIPDNLPKGSPIEVTLSLNNEGILEIYGKDLTSGVDIHATLQAKVMMSNETFEEIKSKSKSIVVE